eukprot:CAMPEP_0182850292 /NCGR_PEP_ID=MMETSP0006_2-20121128/30013_1 /TAXON_ID=97485 /ORGANISM="Prymnesium parvum, Strain Texoma1" /LENGTH=214 /DNA_ID=CAMNT_0024980881 /DNA_START=580 /DNA_END=1226 /DNA_ORIENTATION=+
MQGQVEASQQPDGEADEEENVDECEQAHAEDGQYRRPHLDCIVSVVCSGRASSEQQCDRRGGDEREGKPRPLLVDKKQRCRQDELAQDPAPRVREHERRQGTEGGERKENLARWFRQLVEVFTLDQVASEREVGKRDQRDRRRVNEHAGAGAELCTRQSRKEIQGHSSRHCAADKLKVTTSQACGRPTRAPDIVDAPIPTVAGNQNGTGGARFR